MAIQVTGKNIDLGSALRNYVTERVERVLDKYDSRGVSAHIFIEKDHGQFNTTCTVHLASGLSLQAKGEAIDAHPCVDEAVEHLEKRLRRYKRRLRDHSQAAAAKADEVMLNAMDYVIRHSHEEEEPDERQLAPAIVAESQTAIRELSVGDAVMAMDLADRSFFIFKNASHGRVNVVYRRDDGHIGWIDPGGVSAQLDRKG
jgi:ribosomal subunit interface protein